MKISIITPVFNAASTLKKTILSVLEQNAQAELEYIVIDGGSTDGSLDIIHRYRDRIAVIISERDRGVYDAMNKGISLATGDVIGIINADDWYNPGALQAVKDAFAQNSTADIVYSPVETYFNGEHLIRFVPGSLERLPFKFTLNHPSCFVKKQVYDRLGTYDLTYSIAADYDFILRAYGSSYSFHYVESSLASYSLNGLSSKPLAKFQQIHQSWQVGRQYIAKHQPQLGGEHQRFYLGWLLKEMTVFPVKHFVKPHHARRLKTLLRKALGGRLPSDQYGAW